MRKFCLLLLLLSLSGCAHLRADKFPTGLGTHCKSYINIPAHIGAGLGLVVGLPLSLALLPITLPMGYIYNESGGAIAFATYPAMITAYGGGTILGSLPYFAFLPFADPPLQDSCPARRYRAIVQAGERKDQNLLPQLFAILKKDKTENRQAAAQALGKMGDSQALQKLLQIFLTTKDLYLKYYCFESLKKLSSPQNLSFWIHLSQSSQVEKVKVALLILGKIKTPFALLQLIKMLDTPYVFWAHKILKKATYQTIAPDPKKWKKWLQDRGS